jgi:hypothetical protein
MSALGFMVGIKGGKMACMGIGHERGGENNEFGERAVTVLGSAGDGGG